MKLTRLSDEEIIGDFCKTCDYILEGCIEHGQQSTCASYKEALRQKKQVVKVQLSKSEQEANEQLQTLEAELEESQFHEKFAQDVIDDMKANRKAELKKAVKETISRCAVASFLEGQAKLKEVKEEIEERHCFPNKPLIITPSEWAAYWDKKLGKEKGIE